MGTKVIIRHAYVDVAARLIILRHRLRRWLGGCNCLTCRFPVPEDAWRT